MTNDQGSMTNEVPRFNAGNDDAGLKTKLKPQITRFQAIGPRSLMHSLGIGMWSLVIHSALLVRT
jgi:hypothetical protein